MEFVEVGSADQVGEGQKQAVQIGGKRVVVVRVEGQLYALGGICTHERANLDEGTLMGYELYCPLHFSCFDVRTGEALSPPADKETAVYAVKVEDGKLLVSSAPVDPDELDGETAPEPAYPAVGSVGVPSTEAPVSAAPTDGAPTADEAEQPPAEVPGREREAGTPPPPAPTFAPAGSVKVFAKLFSTIEDMDWLENAAQSLGAALRPLREGERTGQVFELLHGRLVGHALHPALSDIPIGMWAGQAALDLLGEHDAAGKLSAVGILGGVGAAVTGTADWTVSDGGDRRVGLLHGMGQVAAMVLQGTSLIARARGRMGAAQVLAGAGLGVSGAFAYLGGHLVLGRGVMVDHTAWNQGPRRWTRALQVGDLAEGDAKQAAVDGRDVLVSRVDGVIAAIDNICSHAGAPLSTGAFADGVVTCPWHGSRFCLKDGAVVRGPANHPQPMLETRENDGWIEVRARR
jgi:nitrite reductase/ring-hydroxylating ferredoxin subunit